MEPFKGDVPIKKTKFIEDFPLPCLIMFDYQRVSSHSVDAPLCTRAKRYSYGALTRTAAGRDASVGAGRAGRSSWMVLLKYPNLKVGIYRNTMGTYWDIIHIYMYIYIYTQYIYIYCDLPSGVSSHNCRKSGFSKWVYLLFWCSKCWNYQGILCRYIYKHICKYFL